MRKKEKQITETADILAVLMKAEVMHLAMCDGGQPYVVPVNFGYEDGRIYFHSALKGRKFETLAANPRICFEATVGIEVVPGQSRNACDYGARFESVVGFGTATLVRDEAEKLAGLKALMAHYTDRDLEFPEKIVKLTAVFRIEIESMTGKRDEKRALPSAS